MAQQQIITKPYVGELQDNDSMFINHNGALRQVKKSDADFASGTDMRAEVAAREAFEAREVAAREAFEKSETEARGQFETSVEGKILEKANVDGYYEEMTVGDAEQLISTQFVEDNKPYLFRPTGGSSDVGNRAYLDKIVGGTVAWNQLIKNGNFENSSLWTVNDKSKGHFAVSNGELTYIQTTDGMNRINSELYGHKKLNHKYLLSCQIKPSKDIHFTLVLAYNYANSTKKKLASSGVWNNVSGIIKSNEDSDTSKKWIFPQDSLSEGDSYIVKNFMLFDLTQMFGTTIADYIYSLEQSQAGEGVAWFKKLFPKDYYEYNAGELLSVEGLQGHDAVGFNAFDIATNKAKLLGGYQYEIVGAYTSVSYEDVSGNVETLTITNRLFTPTNNGTLNVVGADSTTCVHLVWSGSRNGEYEPYKKYYYPLDSSLTLRGIPKLDASNNLYYDGDEYTSDGTVTRKYAEYTFTGSEHWGWFDGSNQSLSFWHCSPLRYNGKKSDYYPCSNGIRATVVNNTQVRIYASHNQQISSSTNMNTLFTSGTKLVYELATPTTETAEPFQHIQIVDDFGTEEFVSTGIVPVGHNTRYPANLRDKIQHLPDLAGMDGTYLIKQTGKQMSLVHMPAVFPDIPTEDGTYTLKTVVTGGVATLQWVAE